MDLSDYANVIISITSIVAIGIALVTFWQQNRQARMHLGIQILRDWEKDFFYSDRLQRSRFLTCKYFSGRNLQNAEPQDIPAEAWFLLDHFGSISYYVRKGIIEEELAWMTFYNWLDAYWCLLGRHVDWLDTQYDGIQYLRPLREMHEALTIYGVRYCKVPDVEKRHSEHKIKMFIDDELRETYDARWATSLGSSRVMPPT